MKKILQLMLMAILCLSLSNLYSQVDTANSRRDANGFLCFVKFGSKKSLSGLNPKGILKQITDHSEETEFRSVKTRTDKYGYTHENFDEFYKGLKVAGFGYSIHTKEGNVDAVNGHYLPIKDLSVSPSLSESSALLKALAKIEAKSYRWNDKRAEKMLKELKKDESATYYPKGELLIASVGKGAKQAPVLVWKFQIYLAEPFDNIYITVNAKTGDIVQLKSELDKSNVTISADTKFSGTVSMTGDSYGGGYRLYESRNSLSIHTFDCQGMGTGSAIELQSSSTNFNSSTVTGFSTNQAVLDAHQNNEYVSDYWTNVWGQNGPSGTGAAMVSYANFSTGGSTGGLNAYFDYSTLGTVFGNGQASYKYPYTSLDIVAHEWGHAFAYYNNYFYASSTSTDEAYALSEGFSDIWGALAEYYVSPSRNVWQHGDQLMANGKACDRDLANPKNTNTDQQCPDTYLGINWSSAGEQHYNSTILSHWFYLLCQGGYGTNDNGSLYNVAGIGISQASQILYEGEISRLTSSNPDYYDCRDAMILAAQHIYGAGTCQERAVINAWHAVGVGDGYFPSSIYFSGSKYLCSSPDQTYTVYNLPTGFSYSWSTNTSYATIASSGSNTVTLHKVGDGTDILQIIPSTACPDDNISNFTYEIAVGNAVLGVYDVSSSYVSSSNNTLAYGGGSVFTRRSQSVMFNIKPDMTYLSSLSWSPSGTYSLFYGYTSNALLYLSTPSTAYSGNYASVTVTGTGACGSINKTFNFSAISNGSFLRINASPNPSRDNINIALTNEEDTTSYSQEELRKQYVNSLAKSQEKLTRFTLYNFYTNALVKQWKYDEIDNSQYRLNIIGIPKGIYVLKMERGVRVVTTKIIVE